MKHLFLIVVALISFSTVKAESNNSMETQDSSSTTYFAAQPIDASITVGQKASFIAGVYPVGTYSYQWQVSADGTTWSNLIEGGNYKNTQTSELKVTGAAELNNKQYRCIATITGGSSLTSKTATLHIQ